MCHKHIRIPRENANEIMRALGSLENAIEFVDLTKDDIEAKKNFGSMLKRCEEMNTKILDLEGICQDFHQPFEKYKSYGDFAAELGEDIRQRDKKYGSTYFDLVEAEVLENDKKIKELVSSHSQIREDLINLIEKKHVLMKTSELTFTDNNFKNNFGEVGANVDGVSVSNSSVNLNFMAGVVKAADELKMKRMIFRVSRGRAITTFYDLTIDKEEYLFTTSIRQRGFSFADKDKNNNLKTLATTIRIKEFDDSSKETRKKIFNIIFQGGEENILLGKILKVCEIFQASRYGVPKTSDINSEVTNIEGEINDKKRLLITTETNIRDILEKLVAFNGKRHSKLSLYKLFFLQEKMVYLTLNKCILRDTFLDGEVWIPKTKMDSVMNIIQTIFSDQENKLTASLQDIEENNKTMPPTYIPTNDFLWGFQLIVNTYGTPRYREINPAYFNIITFPFLFGVMFGDIAHGFILFLFGLYLCIFSDKIEKSESILKGMTKAKYLLLLMGFFACYCGWIYNDFLSIPIEFGTCYPGGPTIINGTEKNYTINREPADCVYHFGIDPKWYVSKNELNFVNSLKMKLSVILGVAHMGLGVLLKGLNSIFELNFVEFFFAFLPQITLLGILFGYMDALIFIKWSKEWNPSRAADIKSIMMGIFLNFGKRDSTVDPIWGENNTDDTTVLNPMDKFHIYVALISVGTVLIMIVPRVLIEFLKTKRNDSQEINQENQESLLDMDNEHPAAEKPKFSDIFVHVLIETIEFVLGTVSNTASYLRLWALSLAHGQLSKVFFDYAILYPTVLSHPIINVPCMVIIFFVFAAITIAVLLFMDLMECFLHTLRLHWVEFQNKFFKADGYEFKPFSFRRTITSQAE